MSQALASSTKPKRVRKPDLRNAVNQKHLPPEARFSRKKNLGDVDKRSVKRGAPEPRKVSDKQKPRIAWCFTHPFDPDEPHINVPRTKDINSEADRLYGQLIEHCEIFIFQLEHGQGDTQRPDFESARYLHWQGYFELKLKKTHSWIRKNILDFWYVAVRGRFSKPTQAWDYCKKLETHVAGPWMLGKPTDKEGENRKIDQFIEAIQSGSDDNFLAKHHGSCFTRYTRCIDRLRQGITFIRSQPLRIILFYGSPGSGKTKHCKAFANALGLPYYKTPLGRNFWMTPALFGKKFVRLEDFKSNIQLSDLLNLLDDDPSEVELKGSHINWNPDWIVITTNRSPWDWYKYLDRDKEREALFRRFTVCFSFQRSLRGVPEPKEIDIWDEKAFHKIIPPPPLTLETARAKYHDTIRPMLALANDIDRAKTLGVDLPPPPWDQNYAIVPGGFQRPNPIGTTLIIPPIDPNEPVVPPEPDIPYPKVADYKDLIQAVQDLKFATERFGVNKPIQVINNLTDQIVIGTIPRPQPVVALPPSQPVVIQQQKRPEYFCKYCPEKPYFRQQGNLISHIQNMHPLAPSMDQEDSSSEFEQPHSWDSEEGGHYTRIDEQDPKYIRRQQAKQQAKQQASQLTPSEMYGDTHSTDSEEQSSEYSTVSSDQSLEYSTVPRIQSLEHFKRSLDGYSQSQISDESFSDEMPYYDFQKYLERKSPPRPSQSYSPELDEMSLSRTRSRSSSPEPSYEERVSDRKKTKTVLKSKGISTREPYFPQQDPARRRNTKTPSKGSSKSQSQNKKSSRYPQRPRSKPPPAKRHHVFDSLFRPNDD